MLIDPAAYLIEVTADGARINWERDDYRLSDDEKNRILFTSKVSDTVWNAVDLYLPGLLIDFRNTLLIYSILIFVLFLLASIIMYIIVRREEQLRIRAERNKDEFLAIVSHDLRTPITAIRGSMELVNSGKMGETNLEMKECIGIAINNCQRMSLLINDLLDLQKIEAGKMTFNITQQNLSRLVNTCIENNKGYSDQYKASMSLQDHAEDVDVNVDPSRFEQALTNLLSNAVKYGAKHDNIIVSIERSGEYVRVNVTDHGQGIPIAEQHCIFNRFTQLNNASTVHVKGTGLGLSIVKSLIEEQGGQVGFETTEGQGSTFYISLPIA
jgi:signal transduction histidine kinase